MYEGNLERTTSACLLNNGTIQAVIGRSGFELGDDGVNK
jgi:hypothetical protein